MSYLVVMTTYLTVVTVVDSSSHQAFMPLLNSSDSSTSVWETIQVRSKGDVDFYRTWQEYKEGFGNINGDWWLGNERIHELVKGGGELLIILRYDGEERYAHYKNFTVGDEASRYRLYLDGFSGTAGDSMNFYKRGRNFPLSGMSFSTRDCDNDLSDYSCAYVLKGGWWYNSCAATNLNGLWLEGWGYGPSWYTFKRWAPLEYTQMLAKASSVMT